MRTLISLLFFILPSIALADPWCLVRDEKTQCIFATSTACYDAVARQGGSCRENYREVGIRGTAPYCVVTATYRRCVHRSRQRCLDIAREAGGGCVKNVERDLELASRNKRVGATRDCEDLACELNEASSVSTPTPQAEQVILTEPDF